MVVVMRSVLSRSFEHQKKRLPHVLLGGWDFARQLSVSRELVQGEPAKAGVGSHIDVVVHGVSLGTQAILHPGLLEVCLDPGRRDLWMEHREDESAARPQHGECLMKEHGQPVEVFTDESAEHRVERTIAQRKWPLEVRSHEGRFRNAPPRNAEHATRQIESGGTNS